MAKSDLSRRRRRHFVIVVVTMLIMSTWMPLLLSDCEKDKSQLPPFWVRPPEFDKGNKRPTLPLRNNDVSSSVEERATPLAPPPPPAYGQTADTVRLDVDWEQLPNTYLSDFYADQLLRVMDRRVDPCKKTIDNNGIQKHRCAYFCPKQEGMCYYKRGVSGNKFTTSSSNKQQQQQQQQQQQLECVCPTDKKVAKGRTTIYRPMKRVWMEFIEQAKPQNRGERCFAGYDCHARCPYGTIGDCYYYNQCMCTPKEHPRTFSAVPLSTALELWMDPCNVKRDFFADTCKAECPCDNMNGVCADEELDGHGDFCHCRLPNQDQPARYDYVRLKVAKERCACKDGADGICCNECNAEYELPPYDDDDDHDDDERLPAKKNNNEASSSYPPPTTNASDDVDSKRQLSTGDTPTSNQDSLPPSYWA